MSRSTHLAEADGHGDAVGLARLATLAGNLLLAALAVLVVGIVFTDAIRSDVVAIDLHQFYVTAQAIMRGDSPYLPTSAPLTEWGGPYPYPPLPALLAIPLTVMGFGAASVFVMALLVVVALATLRVLDVHDWRCYALALLWPPVISAIQTGNLTLWFGLLLALAWRYRNGRVAAPACVGVTLAAKFFLWPFVVWFAATRRFASAALTCAIGVVLLLASWAVIGFDGMLGYPHLLQKLERTVGEDSYTAYIVGQDVGLPSPVARGFWLALGLAVLVGAVVVARRGHEQASFVLAIAASLSLTPIVWLHYFALLLVVVAIAQPRLTVLWFVPLAMIVTPGSGNATPFQTAWTLAIAAVVVAWSVRASLGGRPREAEAPALATPEAA